MKKFRVNNRNAVTIREVATTPSDAALLATLAASKLEGLEGQQLFARVHIASSLRRAAHFVVADPHYEAIPEPYDGMPSWLAYINRTVNSSLSVEQRNAVMAALRQRRSRARRKLVTLEIRSETLTRLQAWKVDSGSSNLDMAISALLDKV
ncbi:hypothetical protein VA599_06510 [Chromobacterium sp. TRC.1.1.SA]|uniref:Uncharacterized protein n=1 Tax=Chromobacterium indicum TaxID=3110228 RepID=A0ABV0CK97_9NEIS